MKALCESAPQARRHFTRLDQVEQLVRASDRVTADNFRRKVLRELVKIKTAWPDLNYSTAKGVLILWPSNPTIAPSRGIVQSQAYPSPVPRPRIAPDGQIRPQKGTTSKSFPGINGTTYK